MIERAVDAIKNADYLLITAGAGMGVDSGLPDFRGKEGFWRAYPVARRLGLSFEELANPYWFENDPHLAWAFYGHRLNLYRKTVPHEGFFKLLQIAGEKKGYFVFTSNVDGQFQKAGFDHNKIEEVHGSIHYLQCSDPCCDDIWSAANYDILIDEENFSAIDPLPKCIHCDRVARPNILMFGDWQWVEKRHNIQREAFDAFLNGAHGSLAILELGAGVSVPTVRIISERISAGFGAPLIRVNPKDDEVPQGAISLKMGAKEAIEKIHAGLNRL